MTFFEHVQTCRDCGCTDCHPCLDGRFLTCGWARPGLCTFCARRRDRIREAALECLTFFAGAAAVFVWVAVLWMLAP